MKIACITPSRIPSVTANSIQAMKMCQALAQTGHDVVLIAPGEGPEGSTRQKRWQVLAEHYGLSTPFEFVHLPPFEGRWARRMYPWRAIWRARELRADMIYTWLFQSAVGGLLLGYPVMLEVHDLPLGTFGPIWYRLFLRLRGRKRELVITKALQVALVERYTPHLPGIQSLIMPNGVDLERYQELPSSQQARQVLGLPQMPTVACTGHLYDGRGAEMFLTMAPNMPDVHFMWVGGRPEHVQAWREKTKAAGVNNVTFAGFIPNASLPLYQAAADILLMPYGLRMGASSGENPVEFFNPMKMYEYMASGRPIITSDLPVIREILDENCALFCPPGDLAAWQAEITHLLDDRPCGFQLAQQARQLVLPYTWLGRAERAFEGF